jgi:hypothetical protein
MESCEKVVEQIKKLEEANKNYLESQKKMIDDITKKQDFCDSRDLSMDHYKEFLDELYTLFSMV